MIKTFTLPKSAEAQGSARRPHSTKFLRNCTWGADSIPYLDRDRIGQWYMMIMMRIPLPLAEWIHVERESCQAF